MHRVSTASWAGGGGQDQGIRPGEGGTGSSYQWGMVEGWKDEVKGGREGVKRKVEKQRVLGSVVLGLSGGPRRVGGTGN